MTYILGGKVETAKKSEYGVVSVVQQKDSILWDKLAKEQDVLMSHTDEVCVIPNDFEVIASSVDCKNSAIQNENKKL